MGTVGHELPDASPLASRHSSSASRPHLPFSAVRTSRSRTASPGYEQTFVTMPHNGPSSQ